MLFDMGARIAEWQRSLLDTTKRNRLIKFLSGRTGGVDICHPTMDAVWQRLIDNNQPCRFPWKRDILGLPAAAIDAEGEPEAESATAADTGQLQNTTRQAGAGTASVPFPDGSSSGRADLPRLKTKKSDGAPLVPVQIRTIAELTQDCIHSEYFQPGDLLTEFTDKKLAGHLTRLSRSANEAETEHGVSTLFVAFGFLRWYESADSEEAIHSPLVLVPVKLDRESLEAPWSLKADDEEAVTNQCLAERLAADFNIKLVPPDHVPIEGPDGLSAYLKQMSKLVKSMSRWEVVEKTAIGVFNFQKLAMWEDLKKNAEGVKVHALCRAIAGDPAVALRAPADTVAAAELDAKVPPESVIHILEADSSQHAAVEAIKRGAHVVIDGPPGTGKSQTIANAIAELLAAGKTILFVSEKTAALEVVKRRLDECGLGDFCLELHSHKSNKREVAAELGRCLDLIAEQAPDCAADFREIAEARRRLTAYVTELHRMRPPLNMTAFQVHGRLAEMTSLSESSQWASPDVLTHDADFLRRATETLSALATCREVVINPEGHPWRTCRRTTVSQTGLEDANHHLDTLATESVRLSEGTLLADLALIGPVESVADWKNAVNFAVKLLDVPAVPGDWFNGEVASSIAAADRLHAATVRARTLADCLGEFSPVAINALTPEAASALVAGLTFTSDLLVNAASLSARERARALRALLDPLSALQSLAAGLAERFTRLVQLMRLPNAPYAFGQIESWARVAAALADGSPIPRSWWDGFRRVDLISVVEQAALQETAAATLRSKLAATFTPMAFAASTAPIVRSVLQEVQSTQWWLFWWQSPPAETASLYVGSVPDRPSLRVDLGELANYHQYSDYARQVESIHADDLAPTPSGRRDWAMTLAGLRAVEGYAGMNLPLELQLELAPAGGMDRARLAELATEVLSAHGELHAAWLKLQTVCALRNASDAMSRAPSDLARLLQTDVSAATAEAAALDQFTTLLRDGYDLSARDAAHRAAVMLELASTRADAVANARKLANHADAIALEAKDWSALAATAKRLAAFVGQVRLPLSDPTVVALTDPAARQRVEAAVRLSESVKQNGFDASWDYVTSQLFDSSTLVSPGVSLNGAPIRDVARWTRERSADTHRLEEWVRYVQVRRDATDLGIKSVMEEVRAGRIGIDNAPQSFRKRFFGLWLDALYGNVPALQTFNGDSHASLIARFAELDLRSIATASARTRQRLTAGRRRTDDPAPDSSEQGILQREAHKQRRHMSLRKLFIKIPTLLPRIKPCMMMSPLAVSTYFNSPNAKFDVVIFDEASQVRPHDAISAVYRGTQLVVAGDPKQLPPTDFFSRTVAEDADANDDEAGTAGFESLLDIALALGLTHKRLKWHYRSRHEGLIAFSNKHFYDGNLVTFPSADAGARPVRFVHVADGRFESGVNVIEARRVAGLVIDHARKSPDRSLGVIAFSQQQQNRILDELDARRKENPDLEDFFSPERPERFFVKNLENVQGDERDAILLSVGYGPNATGFVSMNFGPLNKDKGERRLNVAVSRAKAAMTVVASMTAADIDLSRSQAKGVRLLKAFLDYADRGPTALVEAVSEADGRDADSPFETEVQQELEAQGLKLHRQVGLGGFRIDLAVVDPKKSGRYLLGIECDGATYHSSATARDRDRLRQSVLEGLGWRLCRIWSTDWLRNREKQVQKVFAALKQVDRPRQATVKPTTKTSPSSVPAKAPPPDSKPTIPTAKYADIGEVPDVDIRAKVLSVIDDFGTTEQLDVCRSVSRSLGFQRMGARIEARIIEILDALVQEGQLVRRSEDGEPLISRPPGDK